MTPPMPEENIDVTILMPCLDEARSLAVCIAAAQDALTVLKKQGLSGEILISDNGSTDGSQEIARKLGCRVVSCSKKGYGAALINGCKAAKGRFIVMGDADASYDFRESVPMVLKLREGYELCMGSRFKGKIMPGAMPRKNRYLGNPALTGLLNIFYKSKLTDAHCGLRAFTKKAFKKLRLSCPGMEFASEMVVRAALIDLKRTELPVTLYPDQRGRPPHLQPWRDGKRHLKFLLMYGPLWMFFLPAFLLMSFGCVIFTAVFEAPTYQTFSFGEFRFGDHWMILSAGIFTIGFQGAILGTVTLIYRFRLRHLPSSDFVRKCYRLASLRNILILGTAFFATGAGILCYVIWQWIKVDFGALYRLREMVLATTFLITGLQTFFSCLLMIILGSQDN